MGGNGAFGRCARYQADLLPAACRTEQRRGRETFIAKLRVGAACDIRYTMGSRMSLRSALRNEQRQCEKRTGDQLAIAASNHRSRKITPAAALLQLP